MTIRRWEGIIGKFDFEVLSLNKHAPEGGLSTSKSDGAYN